VYLPKILKKELNKIIEMYEKFIWKGHPVFNKTKKRIK
jgi:hypothetical protein